MNRAEKEEYLREYSLLKAQGKPFFPYAVAKDAVMACVVMAVIITMSLVLGAELGSKANPTTTTYVPRPAIARTLINPTAPMPSFSRLRQQNPTEFNQLVNFLGSLR